MIDHDNLEEFSDAVNYDMQDAGGILRPARISVCRKRTMDAGVSPRGAE